MSVIYGATDAGAPLKARCSALGRLEVDINSGGTAGQEYINDDPATLATARGPMVLAIRQNGSDYAALADADDDFSALSVDNRGALYTCKPVVIADEENVKSLNTVTNTAQEILNAPVVLRTLYIHNNSPDQRIFVKLYNAINTNVVIGTTDPIIEFAVGVQSSECIEFSATDGLYFSTALSVAAGTSAGITVTQATATDAISLTAILGSATLTRFVA